MCGRCAQEERQQMARRHMRTENSDVQPYLPRGVGIAEKAKAHRHHIVYRASRVVMSTWVGGVRRIRGGARKRVERNFDKVKLIPIKSSLRPHLSALFGSNCTAEASRKTVWVCPVWVTEPILCRKGKKGLTLRAQEGLTVLPAGKREKTRKMRSSQAT